jgi:hypothetical protein
MQAAAAMAEHLRKQTGVTLSPDDLEALRRFEPVVLDWLAADSANATEYKKDPWEALKSAGLLTDPVVTGVLRRVWTALAGAKRKVPKLPPLHTG